MALPDNSPTLTLTSPSPYFRCIPQFVTEDRELYFVARHLFTVIAQAVNLNTNRVQMTIEELAERAGISVRSVIRYTSELEKKGHIRVERAARGSKIPNVYHLAGDAGRIVLRRAPDDIMEEQAATGQPTSQAIADQVPASQSSPTPAPTTKSPSTETQAADTCQSDTRTTALVAVDEAQRVPLRPITKDLVEAIDEKEIELKEERSVVVADPLAPIFKLDGLSPEQMQALIDHFGAARMREVLNNLDKQKHVGNPVGWVIVALRDNWQFGRASKNKADMPPMGSSSEEVARYFGGKYFSFIQW